MVSVVTFSPKSRNSSSVFSNSGEGILGDLRAENAASELRGNLLRLGGALAHGLRANTEFGTLDVLAVEAFRQDLALRAHRRVWGKLPRACPCRLCKLHASLLRLLIGGRASSARLPFAPAACAGREKEHE
jgi:hypothetical protein